MSILNAPKFTPDFATPLSVGESGLIMNAGGWVAPLVVNPSDEAAVILAINSFEALCEALEFYATGKQDNGALAKHVLALAEGKGGAK